MDALEAINRRRSCRTFEARPVGPDLLERIVDAGRRAPSARNVQPCEFLVVTESSRLSELAEMTDHGRFLAHAAACIAVIARDTKYYLEDGCAATENLLIAATALGLGSCWIAGDKKPYAPRILELLGVPPDRRLVSMVALGYALGDPGPEARRPLAEVIHWERY